MKRILFFLMTCLSVFSLHEADAQGDNLAMDFEGSTVTNSNGDFIERILNPVLGNSDFTVEGWFLSRGAPLNIPQFRRLFSLSGTTRFEVGENGSNLVLFWQAVGQAGSFNVLAPITTSTCYHIAVVRNGATVEVYLNGLSVSILPNLGTLNISTFRVGHWGGGQTPLQDWEGLVDEVRLWNTVRTQGQIQDFKDCTISGSSLDLVLNWTFDQTATGIVPGGNNLGASVQDMSGNNNGTPFNFTLNGAIGNFVLNTCPPLYGLNITDLPSQSTQLAFICSGSAAHFCVTQNGLSITSPPGGATVTWWYQDVPSTTWTMVSNQSLFTGTSFCFGVPSGETDLSAPNCTAANSPGYVDRKYRATITKTGGGLSCTYTTSEQQLRIYCPVTNAAIAISPPIPNPPLVALCEGTNYSTTVSITSTDPFVVPPAFSPIGDLSIQWCLNGLLISPLLDNQVSFPYSGVAAFPDLCFEAKLQNGVCPLFTTKTCIPVDKDPKCGTIDATPDFPVLMHDPNGGPFDYLICPGNDAELTMVNPFMDCNAVWQYMFPNTNPIWTDLNGIGNSIQNTNVLPQGPGQPVWPAGETCIQYRIECRPLSYPYSDCAPCHSNIVQICLKTPKAAPVITAGQNPICKSGSPTSTTISVLPYDANCTYNWYCNGILVGNGPSIIATMKGCYWVEVFDGCFKQVSQPLNLDVCEVVAVILCPTDNPCACPGQPVTLDGCSSWDSCNLPLTGYSWTGTDGQSSSGCLFTDLPNLNGTTYTLTVTNAIGCTGSASLTINPCQ